MNILIITGGKSSERKISLLSAKAVKVGLEKNGHAVALYDFKHGYVKLRSLLAKFDVVFPVMHGKEGEDGGLYKFLKLNRKTYVGADPKGAALAFNKLAFKKFCKKQNIPTPVWKAVSTLNDIQKFGFPCVLKGAFGGSSHEVVLVQTKEGCATPKVQKLLHSGNQCFVEKLIIGTEVTIGVLGGKALPVIEIIPPTGAWFDYKNKYSGATREVPFAPSIKPTLQRRMQKMALAIHNKLKLGSFSRTDIIVQNNIPYVLEINTPGGVGLTAESLFPKAAKAAGYTFAQMVEALVWTNAI